MDCNSVSHKRKFKYSTFVLIYAFLDSPVCMAKVMFLQCLSFLLPTEAEGIDKWPWMD